MAGLSGCAVAEANVESQALAAVLVEHGEDAPLAAMVGAVTDEVPSPDVVDPLGLRRDRAGGFAASPGSLGPSFDPQPMFAPDALHEFTSGLPAFTS